VRHLIVPGAGREAVRGGNFAPIDQVQSDGSTALVVPPVAPIAYQLSTFINANSARVQGVDLELHATQRVPGVGDWRSGLTLTWVQRYDMTIGGTTYRLAGTHGPSVSGGTGNPRTRIQWNNALSVDAWTISAAVNYTSGYRVTDPAAIALFGAPETNCADALLFSGGLAGADFATALSGGTVPASVGCRVHSFATIDLTGRFKVGKQLELLASIQNLFDRHAPYDWASYGGAGAPYNPALHQSGAIGRFLTVGGSLRF
jgi:iron complex outermembrane receptor protein